MASIVELERAALRLRHHLKIAVLPELKLLCGLRFFASFPENDFPGRESYLREFIPALAEAAGKSNPSEFLPEEQEQLERLATLLRSQPEEIVSGSDKSAFDELCAQLTSRSDCAPHMSPDGWPRSLIAVGRRPISARHTPSYAASTQYPARVTCLFVEHNPDLDLPPRGRVLNLCVTASHISSKTADDDIVVRNPVNEPDDRFLEQARQSVAAARAYLARRFGLSQKRRYRLDFVIDSTGARFTGDSLGVAFAVGAIAAVGKIEVFRERLTISNEAVFTGALTSEGKLESIDSAALKLKIYRAFHSGLKYLVIPREHIIDAWQYASSLEACLPGKRLELVGAETLDAVVSDPRLIPTERLSMPAHLARKAWQAKRSTWVEIPALVALVAILFLIIVPARWMPWFDWHIARIEIMGNMFKAINPNGQMIWESPDLGGRLHPGIYANETQRFSRMYWPRDIDNDGKDELYLAGDLRDNLDRCSKILLFDHNGEKIDSTKVPEPTTYTGDNGESTLSLCDSYRFHCIIPVTVNDSTSVIVALVQASMPARMQIICYDKMLNKISGPYLHTGFKHETAIPLMADINHNGTNDLLLGMANNRFGRPGLLVIDPFFLSGVSPPFDGQHYEESGMSKGSQLYYMAFPNTELNDGQERKAPITYIEHLASGMYEVVIAYGTKLLFDNGTVGITPGLEPVFVSYVFDCEFFPIDVYFSDGSFLRMQDYLMRTGRPRIAYRDVYLRRLLDDVIVYKGDSIIYHPAAGIGL